MNQPTYQICKPLHSVRGLSALAIGTWIAIAEQEQPASLAKIAAISGIYTESEIEPGIEELLKKGLIRLKAVAIDTEAVDLIHTQPAGEVQP